MGIPLLNMLSKLSIMQTNVDAMVYGIECLLVAACVVVTMLKVGGPRRGGAERRGRAPAAAASRVPAARDVAPL